MHLKRLGPYEIGKSLGKGGMGSVYEATNVETGDRVAVKALSPHLATAEGFRERFEAEIESLKALRHEGIVRLYGYGEQDRVLFYSMELVQGISLEDELKAGRRFNWREVTNIAIQLSLALKHAHDHGIVHRDIKPANILLYHEDKVKLADFGIARLFGMNQLTTVGGVLGTADYMSPEQADGRPVTARCDQYSLGGVMYALLAGRPPFRAKNLPQMLQLQRFADPEPVRRYAPDTPEQLERLITQLLAKEPADRFPNMQVLARHLQAMVMALSRPTADDFAQTGNDAGGDHTSADWDHSVSIEMTQAEADVRRPRPLGAAAPAALDPAISDAGNAGRTVQVTSPQEAATLAAEGPPRTANLLSLNNGAAQNPALSPADTSERATRFTTVEEEAARRAAREQSSWLQVAGQLGLLAIVLGGMVGLAYYLSRPPTADQLYQKIAAQADSEKIDSLTSVEEEVNDFLQRFAFDPRAAQVELLRERIALDKTEKNLLMKGRNGRNKSPLLPVEELYLRAENAAQQSPELAAAILQSLVDLHPPAHPTTNSHVAPPSGPDPKQSEITSETDSRTAAIVALAQRRLATLQSEISMRQERQQLAIRERLDAAQRLSPREPRQAAAMYRAIIDLYDESTWAAPLVAEARQQLAELEKKNNSH
jgi:eukaryotic-like serine/threonine-protein kinase